jgi:outer membrane protein insertion porin family
MKIRNIIFLPLLAFSFLFGIETFEGKQIQNIDIQFEKWDPKHSPDPSSILKTLQSHQGENFSQTTFDADLKKLAEEFDRVEPSVQLTNGGVDITIKIWPKPLIHQIVWEGNQKFSSKKLQSELDIKPNTIFNRTEFNKKLVKVRDFLIKRGFFESQISYDVIPLTNSNQVDIKIYVSEGRSGKIKKIIFEGFTRAEKRDITEKMYTKRYNPLYSWLTGSGILREEAIEQDRMTIISYFQDKGYADAQVEVTPLDDPYSNRIIIKISAHKGILYHFGTINIKGNTLLSDAEIYQKILVRNGSPYSGENLRLSAQAIKDAYGQRGYIDTDVQFDTRINESEPVFDVDFYIAEGQQFKIGLIRVVGNTTTQSNVILRESLLVPGEVFDARKLKATQTRLENIGYFKEVNVYAVKSDDALGLGPDYRDVYIEVEETTTGNVNMFLGFSSTDDIFGGLELTERNFNITGIGSAFSKGASQLRGGGEYLHVRASVGSKQTNYLVSWMDPYVRDSLWRLGFEISKTTSNLQSKDYAVDTYGFSVFSGYPLTSYWTFNTKYRLRYTDADIRKRAGQEARALDNSGILAGIGVTMSYDSTDSAYKATRGIRSNIESEYVGLGGKFIFTRVGYTNTLYFPLWSKGTLKARGDVKYIFPMFGNQNHRVPLSEKLFLGGVGTVRGYKPYIIGPKDPTSGDPLGGISSALFSLEYCQEIFKLLDAFVFFDSGYISRNKIAFRVKNFRASAGAGLRIELMNKTPIIVGYGFPINAKKGEKEKFFFSMGGQF